MTGSRRCSKALTISSSVNSFKDIRCALETLNENGARYEFECYDTSHLHSLHYL